MKSNRGYKYKSLVRPIYDEWGERYITRRESLGPEEDLTSLTQRIRNISLSEGATGSGVGVSSVFLPSDPNELLQRRELLLASYTAGNTGVFNELNAINDKLLDMGIFNVELVRRLQQTTFHI